MPLFKKNHNSGANENWDNNNNGQFDNTNTGQGVHGGNIAGAHGAPHHHNDPLYPSPNVPSTAQTGARGAGTGAGVGAGAGGFDNDGDFNDPGVGRDGLRYMGGNDGTFANTSAERGAGGIGGGGGAGLASERPMHPQTDGAGNPLNPAHSSSASGGHSMQGKIERVVGTMIGSQDLKAKGLAKEQEAQALKVQASELSEAERLEQAALARRERAVAHGAHPDHRHLGSHNPGAGAPNMNEMGGGAGYGISGAGGANSGARGGY